MLTLGAEGAAELELLFSLTLHLFLEHDITILLGLADVFVGTRWDRSTTQLVHCFLTRCLLLTVSPGALSSAVSGSGAPEGPHFALCCFDRVSLLVCFGLTYLVGRTYKLLS